MINDIEIVICPECNTKFTMKNNYTGRISVWRLIDE